eukprot:GHVT01076585.1.p1 GENE.GHVT01076585.1~~GHVT01076585.1.p1  ORF type:complete len:136 (+),score=22.21 GHVT01076585.1:360-767(+)
MLARLSGRAHHVHTGVALFTRRCGADEPARAFGVTTLVTMHALTPSDINAYLDVGESFDKAGGYGIQGVGGQLVEKIDGCYFNVMGLPMHRLSTELARLYTDGLVDSSQPGANKNCSSPNPTTPPDVMSVSNSSF